MKYFNFNFFNFFLYWQLIFQINILFSFFNFLTIWKISNYAESYWFLYSNKKNTFETLYFKFK